MRYRVIYHILCLILGLATAATAQPILEQQLRTRTAGIIYGDYPTSDRIKHATPSAEFLLASNILKLAQQGATSGQVLAWNGTAWAPATPASLSVSAGTGISISGTPPNITINNTGDLSTSNEIQSLSLTGQALGISLGGAGVTLPVVNITAGTGITVTPSSGVYSIASSLTGLPSGTSGQTLRHNGTSWISNSFLYNDGASVGVGTAIGTGKFNVEFAGGVGSERVVEFTSSGGWGKRWINMFNTAGALRGLQFGGETSGGGTTNNALSIVAFPSPRVVINKDLTTYDAPYTCEVSGGTDTDGFVVSRGSDPTLAAMLNINADGDGILRSKSGYWTLGDLDVLLSAQNPTAQLHLFAPSGVSTDPVFAIEKSGGFGRTVFNQFYATGGEWGTHITQAFAGVDWMTFRTGGGTYRVGVLNTNPTYNLDVTGTFRATSRTGTATALAGWASDGKSADLTLSGASITGGVLTVNDASATNEGIVGVGAGGASSSVITSNTSSATGVTINAAGILSIAETTSANGGSVTLTATEVDGTVTNEGQVGVGAGSSTSAVITSNTSGATGVTISAGSGIDVQEITSANGGTIIIGTAGGSPPWILGGNTVAADQRLGTNGAFALELETNNITRMSVESDGKVGVGTTSPAANLSVAGVIGVGVPTGATADRPVTLTEPLIRFNSNIGGFEVGNPNTGRYDRISTTSTPSIVANTAVCGTGCTASISGTDLGGTINLNTGTGTLTTGELFTVTYGQSYSTGASIRVIITPNDDNATTQNNRYRALNSNITNWKLQAVTAFNNSITYSFNYAIIQQ